MLLTNETPTKKNIIRKLSSCVVEKFNGFTIVRVENDRSVRKIFYPIDIIYKPVMKWPEETIQCYFSTKILLAYRGTFNESDKIKYSTARECFYCSNFCGKKDKYERHIENCTGQLGVIYEFSI